MKKILSFYGVSPKLRRIAKLAREKPGVVLTTLAHHIDYQFLYVACLLTRRDGADGKVTEGKSRDPLKSWSTHLADLAGPAPGKRALLRTCQLPTQRTDRAPAQASLSTAEDCAATRERGQKGVKSLFVVLSRGV